MQCFAPHTVLSQHCQPQRCHCRGTELLLLGLRTPLLALGLRTPLLALLPRADLALPPLACEGFRPNQLPPLVKDLQGGGSTASAQRRCTLCLQAV
jgi:hypothetical protein